MARHGQVDMVVMLVLPCANRTQQASLMSGWWLLQLAQARMVHSYKVATSGHRQLMRHQLSYTPAHVQPCVT